MTDVTTTTPVLTTPPANGADSFAHQGLEAMEGFLDTLIKQWEADYQTKSKWLWLFKARVGLGKVSRFVVSATDGLVVTAEQIADPAGTNQGTAKKNSVINALDKLYDKVVAPNLPLPAKPFGWIIRYVVVHVILSTLIDFVVAKYNQGNWNAEVKATEIKAFMAESS